MLYICAIDCEILGSAIESTEEAGGCISCRGDNTQIGDGVSLTVKCTLKLLGCYVSIKTDRSPKPAPQSPQSSADPHRLP